MPDFVCMGAQKSGTTWIHRQLEQLPDVRFPRGKEVHYWDLVEVGKLKPDLAWYRSAVSAPQGTLSGDMTPAYAILNDKSVRLFAQEYPDLRVFMILRNPIERAWSSAKMALARAELTMDEVDAHWFRLHFRSSGSTARSDYETTLRRWRRHFSPEQVRHFRFEDIAARPGELIDRIYRFIGGHRGPVSGTLGGSLHQRVHAGLEQPLPGQLWKELRDQYQPLILSLAAYLDEPMEEWLRPPAHLR